MIKNKFPVLFAFAICLFVIIMITAVYRSAKQNPVKEDLLFAIAIGDKQYVLPDDSVSTQYNQADSSLRISVKGLEPGPLLITIPNLHKGPCKISEGYLSAGKGYTGSRTNTLSPTVELYNNYQPGAGFNNLRRGLNENSVLENAIEITSVNKADENKHTNWVLYIINGKIKTTVFNHTADPVAMSEDEKYSVKGTFAILAKVQP